MSLVTAEEIARRTPTNRDRYADLLRVGALSVVVLGHWLLAVLLRRDGELVAGYLLAEAPWTQWLTWGLQVMPIFFVVGGVANATAWRRARLAGTTPAVWAAGRTRRLLTPVLPLLGVWATAVAAGHAAGVDAAWLGLASQAAFVPTWFLAVYVAITCATPLTHRLHVRWGLAVPVALGLGVLAVDLARARGGLPPATGYLNYPLLWGAVHQLGYRWSDGGLRRPAAAVALAAGGYASLAALVAAGAYPVHLVGRVAGASNTEPPTLALLALAVGQLGLVLLVRPAAERWLQRPRVWAGVVLAGSRIMTVFLWHMTALVVVTVLLVVPDVLSAPAAVDAAWWATRPLWLAACAAVLGPLSMLADRAHRLPTGTPSPGLLRVVTGAVAVAGGLGVLAAQGLHDAAGPLGLAVWPVAAVLAGAVALGVVGHRRAPGAESPALAGRPTGLHAP